PGLLDGIEGVRIREEISELAVAVVSNRLIQGDRGLYGAERLDDVLLLVPAQLGQLLGRRLSAVLELELPPDAAELDAPLVDVGRNADRPPLVRDRPLAGLADPPRRVGRELEPSPPVELLDGSVETDDSFLDQVAERDAVAAVALRDRDDEAQI